MSLSFSAGGGRDSVPQIFDLPLWRLRRDLWAARALRRGQKGRGQLFIHAAKEAEERLSELRETEPLTGASLNLGWAGGLPVLPSPIILADSSPLMAGLAQHGLAVDVEALPFARGRFGVVASLLFLHWLNDLPGALVQLRRALRPGGLFLAAVWGEGTLAELRHAFLQAESACLGGASPMIAPFADVKTYGDLLARAGFHRIVADRERVELEFPDLPALLAELRLMGEGNYLRQRSGRFLRRDVLAKTEEFYRAGFATKAGQLRAGFEIVWLTGFAPAD